MAILSQKCAGRRTSLYFHFHWWEELILVSCDVEIRRRQWHNLSVNWQRNSIGCDSFSMELPHPSVLCVARLRSPASFTMLDMISPFTIIERTRRLLGTTWLVLSYLLVTGLIETRFWLLMSSDWQKSRSYSRLRKSHGFGECEQQFHLLQPLWYYLSSCPLAFWDRTLRSFRGVVSSSFPNWSSLTRAIGVWHDRTKNVFEDSWGMSIKKPISC